MQRLLSKNYRKPFPSDLLLPPLIDNHGREITYLRLAITDRCNLRCRYCMPKYGVSFIPHDDLNTYEELERLVSLFSRLGVKKLRITGGEPFVRKGCFEFIRRLKNRECVEQIFLTTNGVNTTQYLENLRELGISGINLSLDTLDRQRFREITRRDHID
jgi:cyclic pyranopterin phosphate synthase